MANLLGTEGNDELTGTPASDRLYGYGGDDILRGESGNDSLYGGPGDNVLHGGAGDDYLWVGGESGANQLYGDAGNDFITAGLGADILEGGAGDDRLYGNEGNDSLAGGTGDDRLYGAQGDDYLSSGGGTDLLYAGAGNDSLNVVFDQLDDRRINPILDRGVVDGSALDAVTAFGETGDDILHGSPGNDTLDGGPGDDWLIGAAGNDRLVSGGGIDALFGGDGNDEYVVSSATVRIDDSGGQDSITVEADWLKIPSSIETRQFSEGAAKLPYWLDAALADGVGGMRTWLSSENRYFFGFPDTAPDYLGSPNSIERDPGAVFGWQAFNEAQRNFTLEVLGVFAGVANLSFVETSQFDQLNTLTFATNKQSVTTAKFNEPSMLYAGSDVFINQLFLGSVSTQDAAVASPVSDAFEASLWLRAIGGALGLKTPTRESSIRASEVAVEPFLSVEVDIENAYGRQLALYSPASGQEEFMALSRMLDGASDQRGTEHSMALGLLDIAALHYLYGPNPEARTGDDVYTVDSARSNFIWDGAGFDTLDASLSLQAVTLFLEPGRHGFVGVSPADSIFAAGQQTVNFGTRIEKLVGSEFADSLTGDEFANVFVGGGGSDEIVGGAGIDTAVFTASYASASVIQGVDSWRITLSGETDVLSGIERLEFSDRAIALDLDGNAGETAKLIGVLLGPAALDDLDLVRAALGFADTDLGLEGMLALGLEILLGTSPSAEEVINLIHNALTGANASTMLVTDYANRINRAEMTAVELALLAAETDLNHDNIDLIGLSNHGLAYALG